MEVRRVAEQVAASPDTPVAILAEPGSGAEELAELIHLATLGQAERPLVSVQCRGVPEIVVRRDLMGAIGARPGTLFVEDVSLVGDDGQARLSAFIDLERRESLKTGSVGRVRVIAGTPIPLEIVGQERTFRLDLAEQLSVVKLVIPPLRVRPDEIVSLAREFVTSRSGILGKRISGLSGEALAKLIGHSYPGNVRELEAIIERAVILETEGVLQERSISFDDRPEPGGAFLSRALLSTGQGQPPSLQELERAYVIWLLKHTFGNRAEAARLLGVSYPTIMKKINDYRIDVAALIPPRTK